MQILCPIVNFLGFFLSSCPCHLVSFLLPLFLPSNSFEVKRERFPRLPLPNYPKEKTKERLLNL